MTPDHTIHMMGYIHKQGCWVRAEDVISNTISRVPPEVALRFLRKDRKLSISYDEEDCAVYRGSRLMLIYTLRRWGRRNPYIELRTTDGELFVRCTAEFIPPVAVDYSQFTIKGKKYRLEEGVDFDGSAAAWCCKLRRYMPNTRMSINGKFVTYSPGVSPLPARDNKADLPFATREDGVLQCLKKGPKRATELKKACSRYAESIRTLRKQGHDIQKAASGHWCLMPSTNGKTT